MRIKEYNGYHKIGDNIEMSKKMRAYNGCYIVGAKVEYTTCYPEISDDSTIYGKSKLNRGDVVKIREVRYIQAEIGDKMHRYILFKIEEMDDVFEDDNKNWFQSIAFKLTDHAKSWKEIKKRNDKIDDLLK